MTKEEFITLIQKAYDELSMAQDDYFFIGNWYGDFFMMMRNDTLFIRPDGYAYDLNPENKEEFQKLIDIAHIDDLAF